MPESINNRGLGGGQAGAVPEASIVSIRQTAQAFSPQIGASTSDTPGEFDETTATDG